MPGRRLQWHAFGAFIPHKTTRVPHHFHGCYVISFSFRIFIFYLAAIFSFLQDREKLSEL